MSTDTHKVPKAMAERFAAITELTDAFCAEKLNDNPRVWMVSINRFVLDARALKRDVQVQLHEIGLIPFVHADWDVSRNSRRQDARR